MKIRKRISIDQNLYNAALKYAPLDHRTFSALVEESLKQIMNRYPKEQTHYSTDAFLMLKIKVDKMADELFNIIKAKTP